MIFHKELGYYQAWKEQEKQRLIDKWNEEADEFNHWDTLSSDEQEEWFVDNGLIP